METNGGSQSMTLRSTKSRKSRHRHRRRCRRLPWIVATATLVTVCRSSAITCRAFSNPSIQTQTQPFARGGHRPTSGKSHLPRRFASTHSHDQWEEQRDGQLNHQQKQEQRQTGHSQRQTRGRPVDAVASSHSNEHHSTDPSASSNPRVTTLSRRDAMRNLSVMGLLPFALALGSDAAASAAAPDAASKSSSQQQSLEGLQFADGKWQSLTQTGTSTTGSMVVPAYFATYLARFLIRYDAGVSSWYEQQKKSISLLSQDEQVSREGRIFGNFAESLQLGVKDFLLQELRATPQSQQPDKPRTIRDCYSVLAQLLMDKYAATSSASLSSKQQQQEEDGEEIMRQIALLFAMLPPSQQPVTVLGQITAMSTSSSSSSSSSSVQAIYKSLFSPTTPATQTKSARSQSSTSINGLLSSDYQVRFISTRLASGGSNAYNGVSSIASASVSAAASTVFTIDPPLQLFEVGIEEEFGQTAVATPFGPLASSPLIRDLPAYSPLIYGLFGISGATGCALTHSVVIPLDVVKTKAQTNPEQFGIVSAEAITTKAATDGTATLESPKPNLWTGATQIVKEEGIGGLLTGAQATIAGYFWYGLSVYPTYTFSKRWLAHTVLSPEQAMVHANDIALVAGAMAAVVASLGLTPLEAARIRVVAEPQQYKPLGLIGTLQSIGLQSSYAGLPSLLARQVIFGSVKFLAFERACDAIFHVYPMLRDTTATALLVSLIAGAWSGCLSSVVSQPADSVLTYVAQNSKDGRSLGVVEGCIEMVQTDGPGSLFRGLGSRCVWAGSIIAGQFLLYDVFRTYFGVSGPDLSQVYSITIG